MAPDGWGRAARLSGGLDGLQNPWSAVLAALMASSIRPRGTGSSEKNLTLRLLSIS